MAANTEEKQGNAHHSERSDLENLNHREHGIAALVAQSEDEPQSPYQLGWRTTLALLTLSMANVCAALSNTTNTTIKFQVQALARSPADAGLAPWIANGNFLVVLAMGPIFGSLSDRLGKKWFVVGGAALGIVGCTVSGSAKTVHHLIGGNIITGFANAGCIVSISCIQEIMPNRFRPWAMGVSQFMASAFVVLGTFTAAAMVRDNVGDAGGWRWAYYFSAIIYSFTAVSISLSYFPPKPRLGRRNQLTTIFAGVDYIGILLMSASLASLIIGITWGGSTYAWNSKQCIATLTCGSVGLVLFGIYEAFVVKEGILDHRMFQTMNFPILLFVCTIDGMLLLGVNVLYSQEIFDLFSRNAVRIAVILSPYLITSTFGCIPAGWLMTRTKSYREMLVVALFWCSLFTGLMGLVNESRLSWSYAFSTLFGIGTAVTTTIPIVALGLSVPSYLIGTAATISVSCRALGGIIGITIFTAIYDNKYSSYVGSELAAATAQGAAPVNPELSAQAWKYVWLAIGVIVAANGIAACFLKSVAPMMNNHIESALEDGKVREAQLHAVDEIEVV